jgi:hypothetical protein
VKGLKLKVILETQQATLLEKSKKNLQIQLFINKFRQLKQNNFDFPAYFARSKLLKTNISALFENKTSNPEL